MVSGHSVCREERSMSDAPECFLDTCLILLQSAFSLIFKHASGRAGGTYAWRRKFRPKNEPLRSFWTLPERRFAGSGRRNGRSTKAADPHSGIPLAFRLTPAASWNCFSHTPPCVAQPTRFLNKCLELRLNGLSSPRAHYAPPSI